MSIKEFTDPLSPVSIWQDPNGTVWISMSDIDPNEMLLDVEEIDKLIAVLTRVRAIVEGAAG